MALILSIETGTNVCSAALARDGKLIDIISSEQGQQHGALLATYVDRLLRDASLKVGDLDAVAVARGPGSYTGLRIGVSLAKGLCYGSSVALVSVDPMAALTCLALESINDPKARYCPMIDARRMEVYTRVFDSSLKALNQLEAVVVDQDSFSEFNNERFLIFGDGAQKCCHTLPWAEWIDVKPSAAGMITLAQEALEAGRVEDIAYFEPLYLKDFVVTTSKKKLL